VARLLKTEPSGDSDVITNSASSPVKVGVFAGVGQGSVLIDVFYGE
jgi:hypothetical protein